MNTKIIVRFALRETMGVILMIVALFWSAGEVGWLPAWALLGVIVSWIVATAVVTLRHSPELLAERLGPSKGAKRWYTIIMGIYGVMQLALLVFAGLDHRFGWTSGIGVMAQIGALVVCCLSYALAVWATASNAYFSQIVRIQTERSHAVATGGQYRFVRHPGYTGTILTAVATPILLTSWWALAVGLLAAVLMILRNGCAACTTRSAGDCVRKRTHSLSSICSKRATARAMKAFASSVLLVATVLLLLMTPHLCL